MPDDKAYLAPWGFLAPASRLGPMTKIDACGDWAMRRSILGWGGTVRGWALLVVP